MTGTPDAETAAALYAMRPAVLPDPALCACGKPGRRSGGGCYCPGCLALVRRAA